MIRILAPVLALFISVSCLGQDTQRRIITTNDGSRFSGTVVSDSADVMIIKLDSPQLIYLRKSQIEGIETLHKPKQYLSRSKGYYIHLTTSILAGKSELGDAYNPSIHLSNGYQISNGIRIGIGSGIENLEVPLIPIFADINYYLTNSRVSPYLYLKSGYSIALIPNDETYNSSYYYNPITDSTGGLIFNIGAGLALFSWEKVAISMGIGYRYQKVTVIRQNEWWGGSSTTENETTFNRIEMQVGFVFR
jgi:hypothetical protein